MKNISFNNIHDFNADQIFDCGQCFRWEKEDKWVRGTFTMTHFLQKVGHCERPSDPLLSHWRGVVGNRLAEVTYFEEEKRLVILDSLLELGRCTEEEAEVFWWNYFDLGRDYGAIKEYLISGACLESELENCVRDEVMEKAVASGQGIRILNQDRWETLLSFIISQNNNIPRIKKCIESVAEKLGEEIEVPESWKATNPESWDGKSYYDLPSPAVLAEATVEDLAECRLGYRDKYLIESAKQIMEGGFDAESGKCNLLDEISSEYASNSEAIESLRCFCGVGPKVANCVALFCLGQVDSFPLDVWMKRVMNQLYGIPENDLKTMKKYAEEHFAPYGGIAQQYLFYYITHRN